GIATALYMLVFITVGTWKALKRIPLVILRLLAFILLFAGQFYILLIFTVWLSVLSPMFMLYPP
ncbi:MAG: hypothetical protein WCS01_14530, partial [bacterium]